MSERVSGALLGIAAGLGAVAFVSVVGAVIAALNQASASWPLFILFAAAAPTAGLAAGASGALS